MNRDSIALMAMAFGYGALASWAIFSEPIQIDASAAKESAAWVQAIGSILAIGVAVAVPYSIHKREQQSAAVARRLRERSYMLFLLPTVSALRENVAKAIRIAGDWSEDDYPNLSGAARLCEVPPELKTLIPHLHEIGAPADPLQSALAHLPSLISALEYADFYYGHQGVYRHEHTGDEDILDPVKPYDELLQNAHDGLTSAVEAMEGALRSDE